MKNDYGSLIWVNDKSGKEYVCTVESEHSKEKKYENLSDSEQRTCTDVNQIVGTNKTTDIRGIYNGTFTTRITVLIRCA